MQPLRTLILFYILVSSLTVQAHDTKKEEELLSSTKCQTLVAVIVDPWSSAKDIERVLREKVKQKDPNAVAKLIYITAQGQPIDSMKATFWPEKYDAGFDHDGSLDSPRYHRLVENLKDLKPDIILPGAESGVLLAGRLYDSLKDTNPSLIGNSYSLAYRNKKYQIEELKSAGLKTIPSIASRNVEDALRWAKEHNLIPGKVVLKPLMSAGSNLLKTARTEQEFRSTFNEILTTLDQWSQVNDEVLVQEYIQGPEYATQGFALNGVYKVTDIIRYYKKEFNGSGDLYVFDMLVPFNGKTQQKVVEYEMAALRALNFKTGWFHAEAKVRNNEVLSMEVGLRLMGSSQPVLVKDILGESQLEVGVDALFNPAAFYQRPNGYSSEATGGMFEIYDEVGSGTFTSKILDHELTALPGFLRRSYALKEGDPIPQYLDMNSSLGHFEFRAKNEQEFQKIVSKVQDLLAKRVFVQP